MLDGDPTRASALPNAIHWVAQLLAGTSAVSVCVLAVAALGLAMLTGAVPVRRAIVVVLGCFIIVGAPTLATSIVAVSPTPAPQNAIIEASPPTLPASVTESVQPYDPYAGASVPQ